MASTTTHSNTVNMQPQGSHSNEGPETAELSGLQVTPQTVELGYQTPENAGKGSSPPERDVSGLGESSQSQEPAASPYQTPESRVLQEGTRHSPNETKDSSQQVQPLSGNSGSDGNTPDSARPDAEQGEPDNPEGCAPPEPAEGDLSGQVAQQEASQPARPLSEMASDNKASDLPLADGEQGETTHTEGGAPPELPEGGALDQATRQDEESARGHASPEQVVGLADPDGKADQAFPQPAVLSDELEDSSSSQESGSVQEESGSADDECGSLAKETEERGSLADPGDVGSSEVLRQNARPKVYARKMRQGVAIFCSVLGLLTFLLSTVLTYQIAIPGMQHMFFNSLMISNATEGFNTPNAISHGLYKSWYFWNITNQNSFTNGSQPPMLQQVGPYTMQQVVKIKAVQFPTAVDEVLRSTIVYGIYDSDRSCETCSLDDSLTLVNEVFMATIASQYNNDPIMLLQAYIPGLITDALQHIEAYLKSKKKTLTADVAKQLALQQFRLCNTLDPKKNISITKVDATYTLKYAPEYCAWAVNNGVKYAPTTMNATELNVLFSLLFSGEDNPVAKVLKLINPKIAHFTSLKGLSIELSIGILEYLSYLAKYLAQQFFSDTIVKNNGGLIATRTVRELLYGYYDPWLQSIHGNASAAAWVTQIHSQEEVEHPSRPFPEVDGYMGINRGRHDISKLYWITQQGTILRTSPAALNAREVDWDYGSVTVEAPSGLFFGPLKTSRGQNVTMWLDVWMRHVTLQYIGVGHVHGLEIYKYMLADSSLEACKNIPTSTRKLQMEGPCIYPTRYQGLINMSRFQSAVFQTLPHFYRADPDIAATLGSSASAMQPDTTYEFTMDIEPYFGASVNLSIWFQKVFQVQRLRYLYEKLWYSGQDSIAGSVFIPHSYYHIETTANKSVCDALAAANSTLSAVVFFMINVIPFFSAGCIICGLQCLWRRKKLTLCYIDCIEGLPEASATLELVTAAVMNDEQLQKALDKERKAEQNQIAEFSRRRFDEHLTEHSRRDAELTKQYTEHRRARIALAQAEREAAAREEQARKDLEADRTEGTAIVDFKEIEDVQPTALPDISQTHDSAISVPLLEVDDLVHEISDWPAIEETPELLDVSKPDWARTASLVEAEGPIVKTYSSSFAEVPIQIGEEFPKEFASPRTDPTRQAWSRTTSLIEASEIFSNATLEWTRTASLIEAWGHGTESSRTWSRTFSTIEAEGTRDESSAGSAWSRSASLIEAEEGRLRWLHPRTAHMPRPQNSPQGMAILSSISEDTPTHDQVEVASMAAMERSRREGAGQESDDGRDGGEATAKTRRVTFKEE